MLQPCKVGFESGPFILPMQVFQFVNRANSKWGVMIPVDCAHDQFYRGNHASLLRVGLSRRHRILEWIFIVGSIRKVFAGALNNAISKNLPAVKGGILFIHRVELSR